MMASTDSFCSGKFCQHQQASHCDLPFCLSLYQLHMLPWWPSLYLIELVKTYLSVAQRADLGGQGRAGRPSADSDFWWPQKSPAQFSHKLRGDTVESLGFEIILTPASALPAHLCLFEFPNLFFHVDSWWLSKL